MESGFDNTNCLYDLECDVDFNNANNNLNYNLNIMSYIFFPNLTNSEFTCINKQIMYSMYEKNKENINNNFYNFKLTNIYDVVKKPFLRLILKKNMTELKINNLLDSISKSNIKIILQNNGINYEIFNVNFLLIFSIYKKLGQKINILDVANFLEENTMDDIKKLIDKKTKDFLIINQKYYFADKNDLYLDLPLLYNYFCCKNPISGITKNLNIIFEWWISPEILSDYILKNPVLMFEEIIFYDLIKRNSLTEFKCMNFNKILRSKEWLHSKHLTIYHSFYNYNVDFLFVEITKLTNNVNFKDNSSLNFVIDFDIDFDITKTKTFKPIFCPNDCDISEYPQLLDIEIFNTNESFINNIPDSYIDIQNVWVSQYNDVIIYGIAVDGVSNMNNWINDKNVGQTTNLTCTMSLKFSEPNYWFNVEISSVCRQLYAN
jgi:hypothetical protein